MNDCIDYLELISAYADGEISEPDKLRLEAHLTECPNCSSILQAYRGISLAVDESLEPAPESLRRGVMDKITGVSEAKATANIRKHKIVNIILTRYVPAAACLAFLLLTIPQLFNIGGSNSMPGTSSMSVASLVPSASSSGAAQAPAGGSGSFSRDDATGENGAYASGGGSNATQSMLDAASSPAGAPMPESAQSDITGVGDAGLGGGVDSDSVPQPSASSPFSTPSSAPAPAESPSTAATETTPQAPSDAAPPVPGGLAALPEELDNSAESTMLPPSSMNMGEVLEEMNPDSEASNFSGVFAIIMITGELPPLLEEYEPEEASDNGELYYEIPRAAAKALIEEISSRDGVVVNITDVTGDYAWVFYTP